MNIQIFGTRKCFDTKKAERYFKERRITFQYIDLGVKNISKGELQSVARAVGLNNMLNSGAPAYKKLNLDRIVSPSMREELMLLHPALLKTPIVRNGRAATVGYRPDIWDSWQDS
jgi:arsenate reductase (glutaredoxin)